MGDVIHNQTSPVFRFPEVGISTDGNPTLQISYPLMNRKVYNNVKILLPAETFKFSNGNDTVIL